MNSSHKDKTVSKPSRQHYCTQWTAKSPNRSRYCSDLAVWIRADIFQHFIVHDRVYIRTPKLQKWHPLKITWYTKVKWGRQILHAFYRLPSWLTYYSCNIFYDPKHFASTFLFLIIPKSKDNAWSNGMDHIGNGQAINNESIWAPLVMSSATTTPLYHP